MMSTARLTFVAAALALSSVLGASSLVESSADDDPFAHARDFVRSLVEQRPLPEPPASVKPSRPRGTHRRRSQRTLLPATMPSASLVLPAPEQSPSHDLLPAEPAPSEAAPPASDADETDVGAPALIYNYAPAGTSSYKADYFSYAPSPSPMPTPTPMQTPTPTPTPTPMQTSHARLNLMVQELNMDEEKEYELLHIELRAVAEKLTKERGVPPTKEELEAVARPTMDRLAELVGLRGRDHTVRGPCPGHCQGRGECEYETSTCKCEDCYGGVDCGECKNPCTACGAGGRCDCCTGQCICSPGYYGDDCTCVRSRWNHITQVDELTASGHGCRADFGLGEATCDKGWITKEPGPPYCGYLRCPNDCFGLDPEGKPNPNATDTDGNVQLHGECNGLGVCHCFEWYVGLDCGCRNCTIGRGECVRPAELPDYAYGDCQCERYEEEPFDLIAFGAAARGAASSTALLFTLLDDAIDADSSLRDAEWGVAINFSLATLFDERFGDAELSPRAKALVRREFARRANVHPARVDVRTSLGRSRSPLVVVTIEATSAADALRLSSSTELVGAAAGGGGGPGGGGAGYRYSLQAVGLPQHQHGGRPVDLSALELANATRLPVTLVGRPSAVRLGDVRWGGLDCFCVAGCGDEETGEFGSHGQCSAVDGHCECDENWRGVLCDEPYCASNCSLHGACITDRAQCQSIYGDDANFPCCECSVSFDPASTCAEARRRLGWAWVKLSEYVGLGAVDDVPGDLGFVMEPLLGHTLALGRPTLDMPPNPQGVDYGGRSQTLLVWGGKAQFPPVNEFGFRERERCIDTYCSGDELSYTLDDRLWRWDPLLGDSGFGHWQTGESLMSGGSAGAFYTPDRRWMHATVRTRTGVFVHGGLGDVADDEISLKADVQVGVDVDHAWPDDELVEKLRSFIQVQLDDTLAQPIAARVTSIEYVTKDVIADRVLEAEDENGDKYQMDYHRLSMQMSVNGTAAMFDAIKVLGEVDTHGLEPAAAQQQAAAEPDGSAPQLPSHFKLIHVAEPTRWMRERTIYRPDDYVMRRRLNDLWYFKYSNETSSTPSSDDDQVYQVESAGSWVQMAKDRDPAARMGDSPCTYGHAMAVAWNSTDEHGGPLFMFGGRVTEGDEGGCAPDTEEGRMRRDTVSDTLRKVTIDEGQVLWSQVSRQDVDLFTEYLHSRFVDVEFVPWFTSQYPQWKRRMKDKFVDWSRATRHALLQEFNETRLTPWQRLFELDVRGDSCVAGSSLRPGGGFDQLTDDHPCNCVPNDHANGLAGWFIDRIRQWAYVRDVEFALLRNSMIRQEVEYLEEVASVWHEWVCFHWGSSTVQDLADLDTLEQGGREAPCNEEYLAADGAYTRVAPAADVTAWRQLPETFGSTLSEATEIAQAVRSFERTTMFTLRQQLMRDLHDWIEELKAAVIAESDKVVAGEFEQRQILDWNEAMLVVLSEWPCHDELQQSIAMEHYFRQPPPPVPPPSPPPPPLGTAEYERAMATSPPPPSPPPPDIPEWDPERSNEDAVDCTADEWSVFPIHRCEDDTDCLGERTCGGPGDCGLAGRCCQGSAGPICCDPTLLDRQIYKTVDDYAYLPLGACEDEECNVCRLHSYTPGTLSFIKEHCPAWDRGVRWWCYWADRRLAQRTPTYFDSLQNWTGVMWQNWTLCSDLAEGEACPALDWPNDIQVAPNLARTASDLRLIAQTAAKTIAQSLGEDVSSWKAPANQTMLVHRGTPIWACGLLHNSWGCTPDSVLDQTCVPFDPANLVTNAAAEKGGFEGASLDGWHKALSLEQVSHMSGGPSYDRFCTFVKPAPEMSPEAAALPDTVQYAAPPGRYFHTIDYEPVERLLVLFGGTRGGLVENYTNVTTCATCGSQDVLDDMWLYRLPDPTTTEGNYGANWRPVHYYNPGAFDGAPDFDDADFREAKRSAYLAYNGSWFFNYDRHTAEQHAIRPTQRYGHATLLYTANLADFGVDHGLGRWREYRQREDFLRAMGAKEPNDADIASFLFLYGGHDGEKMLDELWVFHFARNPAMKAGLLAANARLKHTVLSARFDPERGPYIGWAKLPLQAGFSRPPPLLHHRIAYIEDTSLSCYSSSADVGTTRCVAAGSIYIVGGMQRPLESTVDGVTGYNDAGGGGCHPKPDDPSPPKAPCVNEACCWKVKGVTRDTGGVVNGLWRLGNIFNQSGEISSQRIAHAGARPPPRMDQSAAVPEPSALVPSQRYDKWVFIYGGSLGPRHLNRKFAGGDYTAGKWTTTAAPVQLKDSDLWAFDMDQLMWELPARNAINTSAATLDAARLSQSPGGLSEHAAVLAGQDPITHRPLMYLVVGGLDKYDDASNGVWAYYFASQQWTRLSRNTRLDEGNVVPQRRSGHAALRLWVYGIETLVIYGGLDSNGLALDDFWSFPLHGTSAYVWKRLEPGGSVPPGRRAPTLMRFDAGHFLLFGGQPQIPVRELEEGEFTGEVINTPAGNTLDELWMLSGVPGTSLEEWQWMQVVEDQGQHDAACTNASVTCTASNRTVGKYYGYWLGTDRKMRKYRDKPEPRAWASGISPPCFSDACRGRVWLVGGYSLQNVLSDVWTLEEEDFVWRLADTSTRPTPARFKSSIAVWEPKKGNKRFLLPQPHIFMLFGVRDFLGGDTVSDVWVFTQVKNTNELEARNKGRFYAPDPTELRPQANVSGWQMEVSGTAWYDNTKPEEPVQVVGPCVTGKHDTRPGVSDPVCMNPPAEEPQDVNSLW